MKRFLAGIIIALPLAIASIPTSASAIEIIVNPRVRNAPRPIRREVIVNPRVRYAPRPIRRDVRANRRVLVPAHWERTRQGRIWVPAQYQYRR